MSALNSWQKVSRVLGGDFGDGKDGNVTISADPNTRATFTGSAGASTGTAGATTFLDGDLVKLIQYHGTNSGQWEYNLVASGGGSTSLSFSVPFHYTYVTGAQIIKIPRYVTATIQNHSTTAWDTLIGGDEEILCLNLAGSGNINGNGGNGSSATSGTVARGTGGYRGGTGDCVNSDGYGGGYQGDGEILFGSASSKSPNPNWANIGMGAGACGYDGGGGSSGAGGGHAASGGIATNGWHQATGGSTNGQTDLTTEFPGGGGAGGGGEVGQMVGAGGAGGCIIHVICQTSTYTGTISVNGGNGGVSGDNKGGGGGAGGSILIVTQSGVFTGMTSTGGSAGDGSAGAGGIGRIAIHHSKAITGSSSNPTFTDVTDTTLHGMASGAFIFNLL